LTEEEIKTVIDLYLTSKRLFKPHDPNLINVSQDKLLLGIVLNGEEGKRAGLLEGRFMATDKVINKIVSNTKAYYKISTCDRRPIIRSVLYFGPQRHSGCS
jgi:hypothetical protein